MLLLLGVGFLGGLVTGISPCIIPVLPVIVVGGSASDDRRRPWAVVAGLVLSFSVFTLVGGQLLALLHLPEDLLWDLGLAMLFAVALGLLVPRLGQLLERPFAGLGGRTAPAGSGSGLVLGASLGLVFVPCAGPVLAAISVVAATHRVGVVAVLLTLSYAVGVAVPLLVLALVAQRTRVGWTALRRHLPAARRVAGAVIGLTALVLALDLAAPLQTSLPGYTSALENHFGGSGQAASRLQALTGEGPDRFAPRESARRSRLAPTGLPDLGAAPAFTGITRWLDTPGGRPLRLGALHGKVVLVDFWTYSCINCQRALPHVEAWYRAYRSRGLVVVGVHTPEFPFEHVVANVRAAAAQLGVTYPVAIDDDDRTWDAYDNQDWPAEYLIDQNGRVRHTQVGEGDYQSTEADIRLLLGAGGAGRLPAPTGVADRTPEQVTTPETYLGSDRLDLAGYVGSPLADGRAARYRPAAAVPPDGLSLDGTWTVGPWADTAGAGAALELRVTASDVYLVLGGRGTVSATLDGVPVATRRVAAEPRLYTLISGTAPQSGLLVLHASPGVQAYDFTFG